MGGGGKGLYKETLFMDDLCLEFSVKWEQMMRRELGSKTPPPQKKERDASEGSFVS